MLYTADPTNLARPEQKADSREMARSSGTRTCSSPVNLKRGHPLGPRSRQATSMAMNMTTWRWECLGRNLGAKEMQVRSMLSTAHRVGSRTTAPSYGTRTCSSPVNQKGGTPLASHSRQETSPAMDATTWRSECQMRKWGAKTKRAQYTSLGAHLRVSLTIATSSCTRIR